MAFHDQIPDRLAAGELVGLLQIAGLQLAAGNAAGNLRPRGVDHGLVVGVLPLDQLFNQVEELGTLQPGRVLVNAAVGPAIGGVAGRVVHERAEQHRPARRQRPPRPPQVQRCQRRRKSALFRRRRGIWFSSGVMSGMTFSRCGAAPLDVVPPGASRGSGSSAGSGSATPGRTDRGVAGGRPAPRRVA